MAIFIGQKPVRIRTFRLRPSQIGPAEFWFASRVANTEFVDRTVTFASSCIVNLFPKIPVYISTGLSPTPSYTYGRWPGELDRRSGLLVDNDSQRQVSVSYVWQYQSWFSYITNLNAINIIQNNIEPWNICGNAVSRAADITRHMKTQNPWFGHSIADNVCYSFSFFFLVDASYQAMSAWPLPKYQSDCQFQTNYGPEHEFYTTEEDSPPIGGGNVGKDGNPWTRHRGEAPRDIPYRSPVSVAN